MTLFCSGDDESGANSAFIMNEGWVAQFALTDQHS